MQETIPQFEKEASPEAIKELIATIEAAVKSGVLLVRDSVISQARHIETGERVLRIERVLEMPEAKRQELGPIEAAVINMEREGKPVYTYAVVGGEHPFVARHEMPLPTDKGGLEKQLKKIFDLVIGVIQSRNLTETEVRGLAAFIKTYL